MPIPDVSAPAERQLLADGLYRSLLDAIVDGTLLPGETVSDASIAVWAGVSRTPAREALDRLALAGFVVVTPRHSTRVAPLDEAAHLDVLDALGAIAVGATEFSVRVATAAERSRVLTSASADGVGLFAPDGLFGTVIAVHGDPYVRQTWDDFVLHARRHWTLRPESTPPPLHGAARHAFDDAVQRGDGPAAADIVDAWFTPLAGER